MLAHQRPASVHSSRRYGVAASKEDVMGRSASTGRGCGCRQHGGMPLSLMLAAIAAITSLVACSPARSMTEPTPPLLIASDSSRGESVGSVSAYAMASAIVRPLRPAIGGQTLGFGRFVSWATKPHNGIDYASRLGNTIVSPGSGTLHVFTKPNAARFGSINPDGPGPALWLRLTLNTGDPVYVLYGHTADSWADSSRGQGRQFRFSCTYLTRAPGMSVQIGASIGRTAPFYNGGLAMPHLHMSVFKPYRDSSGNF